MNLVRDRGCGPGRLTPLSSPMAFHEPWLSTFRTTGRALFEEKRGIDSQDPEEIWQVYVTYLASQGIPLEITEKSFTEVVVAQLNRAAK